jgi:V8-like Glu-specific endopeptidase
MSTQHKVWLIVTVIIVTIFSKTAQSQDRLLPSIVAGASVGFESISLRLDVPTDANGTVAGASGADDGADFLRLRLFVTTPTRLDSIKVVVSDGAGHPVDTIDLTGVAGAREYWTRMIPGKKFSIRATGKPQAPGSTLTVWQLLRSVVPPTSLSIIGTDDREPFAQVADVKIHAAGRAVVKLLYQEGPQTYACTGFLISQKRVVTNEHCIATEDSCATTVVLFDYDTETMVPAANQRRCSGTPKTNHELDYSVLDLDQPADGSIHPLQLAGRSAANGESLLIIEHPGGEPKQISRTVCKGVQNPVRGNGATSDFTHSCATLGGSSGSPVLNSTLQVVGLHHFGVGGDELNYNRAVRVEPITQSLAGSGLYP